MRRVMKERYQESGPRRKKTRRECGGNFQLFLFFFSRSTAFSGFACKYRFFLFSRQGETDIETETETESAWFLVRLLVKKKRFQNMRPNACKTCTRISFSMCNVPSRVLFRFARLLPNVSVNDLPEAPRSTGARPQQPPTTTPPHLSFHLGDGNADRHDAERLFFFLLRR